MSQTERFDTQPAFQIKGSMMAASVLELLRIPLDYLERQLADKVQQAPQLFLNSPLILGLDKLRPEDGPLDLQAVLAVCRRQGLHTVAVRGGRPDDMLQAAALGLPVLPPMRGKDKPVETPSDTAANRPAVAASAAAGEIRASKLITQPVRGGQQIYAANADLIVLAPVSAGAEVIADGHIHVYAPLRGRALAGVQGETSARIFCQELGAEMVAVAGHYRIADELKGHALWGKAVQIHLTNGELNLATL